MKTFIVAAFGSLLLLSCNNKKMQPQTSKTDSETTTVTTETFRIDSLKVEDSISVGKYLTAKFSKQILVFPDVKSPVVLDSIYTNAGLKTKAFDKNSLLEALKAQMKSSFEATKEENSGDIPEFKSTYEDDSYMKVHSHLGDVLSLQYAGYTFTGGAHGMSFEFYKNFDLKDSHVIEANEVLINPKDPAWNQILLKNFTDKDQKEMLLEEHIFPNKNFYFDNKAITFVYNQYEITAYAAGIVYITVPFAEIKDKIKPEFLSKYGIQ